MSKVNQSCTTCIYNDAKEKDKNSICTINTPIYRENNGAKCLFYSEEKNNDTRTRKIFRKMVK